jgi:hypothetical protein
MNLEAQTPVLSWRIPTTGDPRRLKLALAQVGLATIVAALVLLVAAPREWLVPALVGLIPLAVFVAYRRWQRFQQSLVGPANVWIDGAGVHWLDAAGAEQQFARDAVTGFRVSIEEDTLRAVPALTLQLAGGFESQPLELYPPATPEIVRELLSQSWGIAEHEPRDMQRNYDHAVDVYSECHEEARAWHWEGTREALTEFIALVAGAARELPPPPPGARPAQRIILCRRREPARLRLAHAAVAHLDHDLFAAPAAVIADFAGQADDTVATAKTPSDTSFEVRLPNAEVWTFHLHVREPSS